MPKFSVSKTVRIEVPVEKVYAIVRDFRQWRPWSPWLIAEPTAEMQFSDDGRSYLWSGKIVGSGSMEILAESASESIGYRLTFLTPWKSVSDVSFTFASPSSDSTEVTWTMDGSLPFFMFWMTKMMTTFIGMDYERGLKMLKDYAETGSVPSQLEFKPQSSVSGFRYIGIRSTASLANIGPKMQADFGRLFQHFETASAKPSGKGFAVYHSFNASKGETEYTCGFPVEQLVTDLLEGFVSAEIPACQTYAIAHTGPYRHLGNAWAAGMMRGRSKQFKQNKKIPPLEIYENDPSKTPENDLLTTVHFPAR